MYCEYCGSTDIEYQWPDMTLEEYGETDCGVYKCHDCRMTFQPDCIDPERDC